MKKLINCDCGQCTRTEHICDTCGETLRLGTPVELSFGYGSPLDGNDYDFCGLKCIFKFIAAETAKETK